MTERMDETRITEALEALRAELVRAPADDVAARHLAAMRAAVARPAARPSRTTRWSARLAGAIAAVIALSAGALAGVATEILRPGRIVSEPTARVVEAAEASRDRDNHGGAVSDTARTTEAEGRDKGMEVRERAKDKEKPAEAEEGKARAEENKARAEQKKQEAKEKAAKDREENPAGIVPGAGEKAGGKPDELPAGSRGKGTNGRAKER